MKKIELVNPVFIDLDCEACLGFCPHTSQATSEFKLSSMISYPQGKQQVVNILQSALSTTSALISDGQQVGLSQMSQQSTLKDKGNFCCLPQLKEASSNSGSANLITLFHISHLGVTAWLIENFNCRKQQPTITHVAMTDKSGTGEKRLGQINCVHLPFPAVRLHLGSEVTGGVLII